MNNINKDFSVIVPIYYNDNPSFFRKSLESLINQTVIPDEIIISIDGVIPKELRSEIERLQSNNLFTIVENEINQGAGVARDNAIKSSKNELIALMDADDISVETRFEEQLKIFAKKDVDIVGAWIEEFSKKPHDLGMIRKTPEMHDDIFRNGKYRVPINNVTLMFQKKAYFSVGGYGQQRNYEDGNLIARMLANGIRFYNIQKVLVHARGGSDMVQRRRSYSHFINELKTFPMMYNMKYINFFQMSINIIIRVSLRILPFELTNFIYKHILRKKI